MKQVSRLSRLACAALLAMVAAAAAQQAPSASTELPCSPSEPDSVQISWDAPCNSGDWLFEPGVGCRMWDWHPAPEDEVTWTGRCARGARNGHGVAQWFEHGRPIDRFEGTFVSGRRTGPGRYRWNEDNWYVGQYQNDLPNGLGTAYIAGETFSGQWRAGCLHLGTKTVAIGTPLKSCDRTDLHSPQTAERRSNASP